MCIGAQATCLGARAMCLEARKRFERRSATTIISFFTSFSLPSSAQGLSATFLRQGNLYSFAIESLIFSGTEHESSSLPKAHRKIFRSRAFFLAMDMKGDGLLRTEPALDGVNLGCRGSCLCRPTIDNGFHDSRLSKWLVLNLEPN